ncbi:MAG TPA: hypothetical protein VGF75_02990, partial [Candidatus Saccharimonadales bacterium]
NGGWAQTNGAGQFSFSLPQGTPYCLRTVSGNGQTSDYAPPGDQVVVNPGSTGPPPSPPYSPPANSQCPAGITASYELQTAESGGGDEQPTSCFYHLEGNTGYNFDIIVPVQLTCTVDATTSPVAPGGTDTIDLNVGNSPVTGASGSISGATNLTLSFSGGPPEYTDNITIPSNAQIGTATINATVTGGAETIPGSCTGTFIIAAEPFARVFGGDVFAGVDSADMDTCFNGNSSDGIKSFNNNARGSNIGTGAGTTIADAATGANSGFTSGQGYVLSLLDPLTFSNNVASNYGGSFGSSSCSGQDYYTAISSLTPADTSTTFIGSCPSVISDNILSSLGLTSLGLFGNTITLNPGDKYICYSTTSVQIVSNVVYNLSGATAANLPVFEVVVDGGANADINIVNNQEALGLGSTVTQLAGTYIDEGGDICDNYHQFAGIPIGCYVDEPAANANGRNTSAPLNELIVNGTFIANQLELYRSYGSINDDTTSRTTPPDSYDAEEFDYSPINWLASNDGGNTVVVQSVTGLPPIY